MDPSIWISENICSMSRRGNAVDMKHWSGQNDPSNCIGLQLNVAFLTYRGQAPASNAPPPPPLIGQDHVCCSLTFRWTAENFKWMMARTREHRSAEKKTCGSSSVFSPQWSLWSLPLSHSLRGLLLLIIFLLKPKWILDSGQDERSAAVHHRQRAVSWSKPILSHDPALCCLIL